MKIVLQIFENFGLFPKELLFSCRLFGLREWRKTDVSFGSLSLLIVNKG
ncbi:MULTISPECIES: hypothetical protein [unclassified Enterococcus]|uniref:Uncharacterized protein n=1 Tax=Candidatus Enterococcus dunnyi TaxID=1834192 RepID=A0A200J9L7_9ENTE|nr:MULTISPECIES: hypothetical protein [unclassified Enterococcus]MCA5013148.1 hypothetical protein [Enterococcus sp. S23]MCA5016398.1 hypothetical protein [Enterococcus sp. S22(2020)]OUZ33360.1 hypothetical protein A5889_002073 [Enterococcus sp. 9D6_DIV0238]